MTSQPAAAAPAYAPATSSNHPKYRADIDGLRAIAVLSVVAFHAFPSAIQGGFVGVDVFFVISGYLISSIIFAGLDNRNFSFLDFYSRRITRIFPALLLVLGTTWGLGWFSLLADEFSQLGKHIAAGAGFVSNLVLWGEAGYFDTSAESKILLHLWSLGIEEQFYLIWPLLVWAAWKLRLNTLLLIVVLGSLSFVLNIVNVQHDAVATFYSPQTRFWELLTGSLLAYFTLHKRQLAPTWRDASGPRVRNLQALLGVALLLGGFALTTKNNAFPGWWAVLPTLATALIIAAGPFAWVNRVVLANPLLVWFGLISFPLYLWHWPLLAFARIFSGDTPAPWVRVAAVLASVALAWLTLRLVEQPLRFHPRRPRVAALLMVAMAAVGALGFVTFKAGGFAQRVPQEIQAIADFKYEFTTDARYPDCWLAITDRYDGYAQKCLHPAGYQPGEGILLWGDSHAARLYPGLAAVLGNARSILQATRSSCPSLLGLADPVCSANNSFVLSFIKNSPPHTVILFNAWGRYGFDWANPATEQLKLLDTINQVQAAGVKQVIVLGPSPEWLDPLPKTVYRAWKDDYPQHRIPGRLSNGLNPQTREVDERFRTFLAQSAATYIPLYDLICNGEGCLTHIEGAPAQLMSWDYGHLTTEGATLVVEKLVDRGALK